MSINESSFIIIVTQSRPRKRIVRHSESVSDSRKKIILHVKKFKVSSDETAVRSDAITPPFFSNDNYVRFSVRFVGKS